MQHKTFDSAFKSMFAKIASVNKDLPQTLAATGTQFFVGSFDKEGFSDNGLKPWKVPKRRVTGTNAYKYPKKKDLGRHTRKTLIKKGRLKRAVNKSATVNRVSKGVSITWLIRGSEVPYAARHNYGEGFMPQRRYIGPSRMLNALFKKKIIQAYKIAFK